MSHTKFSFQDILQSIRIEPQKLYKKSCSRQYSMPYKFQRCSSTSSILLKYVSTEQISHSFFALFPTILSGFRTFSQTPILPVWVSTLFLQSFCYVQELLQKKHIAIFLRKQNRNTQRAYRKLRGSTAFQQ